MNLHRQIGSAEELFDRLYMTAYIVKCSLSNAKTVEAVTAYLRETRNDFEKQFADWKLQIKVDFSNQQKINMTKKLLWLNSTLVDDSC